MGSGKWKQRREGESVLDLPREASMCKERVGVVEMRVRGSAEVGALLRSPPVAGELQVKYKKTKEKKKTENVRKGKPNRAVGTVFCTGPEMATRTLGHPYP
jgi:hypothetical protein